MKKRRLFIKGIAGTAFIVTAALILICFNLSAFAAEKEAAVRVGFPIQRGITEIDKFGNYTGYTYDYLREIAQYTGWEYEFVQVEGDENEQILTLMEMLKAGEIDLLGAMNYSDALSEVYDYPAYSYGISYSTLSVLASDSRLDSYNYTEAKNIRVAAHYKEKASIEALYKFADANGFTVETIPWETEEEGLVLLEENKADVIMGKDVRRYKGTRIIAKYAPVPYYFATTKGNTELVKELNHAILNLSEIKPSFMQQLYERYFTDNERTLILTQKEQDYIKENNTVRVLYMDQNAPLQYKSEFDGETEGISSQVVEYIAELTGLKFEFVAAETYEEYQSLLNEEIDLVMGVKYDYDIAAAENFKFSQPYINMPLMLIVNKNEDPNQLNNMVLALVKGNSPPRKHNGEIIYYDTIQDCLEAIDKGEADYTYENSYTFQYCMNRGEYKNLYSFVQEENLNQQYCFALLNQNDKVLHGIMNKSIRTISNQEIQNWIYSNTFPDLDFTLREYIIANPTRVLTAIIFVFSVILLIVARNNYMQKKMAKQIAIENEKYNQLAEISGECIFEYNYLADKFSISKEYVNILKDIFKSDELYGLKKEEVEKNILYGNGSSESIYEWLQQKKDGDKEIRLCFSEDKNHWYRVYSKVIRDSRGNEIYAIGKMKDIQQEMTERESLQFKAENDSLTNIYNSATSKRLIRDLLSAGEKGILFILDIDHFKKINDQYGHYAGDCVLTETAKILRTVFGTQNVVGRLGGDEFIVFLKGEVSYGEAESRYWQIRTAAKSIQLPDGSTDVVTFSVGAASAQEGQDFTAFYKAADASLYKVKEKGRNGFVID